MNRICRMCLWMAALVAVGAPAAEQGVNIGFSFSGPPLETPRTEAFQFLEHFKIAFDDRADELFLDRFGPFSAMRWSMTEEDGGAAHLREESASAARHAFSRSFVYGLREAGEQLPFLEWLRERHGFLADFIRNSLGGVAEEAVTPLGVSYRPAERSWWQRVAETGDVRFGIRPFRTSPYAYVSLGLKEGDRYFLLGHVRYHYRSFADHRFEVALSLPLAPGLSMDLGTSVQFGRRDEEPGLVFKLFKQFRSGGFLHVGVEARQRSAFFAGLSVPW